jgi:hypothetical protein
MSDHWSDVMARFRYVGDQERVLLGPPVRVVSPGDIVEASVNPDPLLFVVVERLGDSPALDPGSSRAAGPPTRRECCAEPVERGCRD